MGKKKKRPLVITHFPNMCLLKSKSNARKFKTKQHIDIRIKPIDNYEKSSDGSRYASDINSPTEKGIINV